MIVRHQGPPEGAGTQADGGMVRRGLWGNGVRGPWGMHSALGKRFLTHAWCAFNVRPWVSGCQVVGHVLHN